MKRRATSPTGSDARAAPAPPPGSGEPFGSPWAVIPRPDETAQARRLLEEARSGDGLTALCRVLLNSNEFVYVD